jgi:hypothetical protein
MSLHDATNGSQKLSDVPHHSILRSNLAFDREILRPRDHDGGGVFRRGAGLHAATHVAGLNRHPIGVSQSLIFSRPRARGEAHSTLVESHDPHGSRRRSAVASIRGQQHVLSVSQGHSRERIGRSGGARVRRRGYDAWEPHTHDKERPRSELRCPDPVLEGSERHRLTGTSFDANTRVEHICTARWPGYGLP